MKRSFLLAILLALGIGGTAHAQSSHWQFTRHVDPITDEVRGIASVGRGNFQLVIKCDYGSSSVYAALYGIPFDISDINDAGRNLTTRKVVERIDSQNPREIIWSRTGNGNLVIMGMTASSFTDRLMSGQRLVLRIDGDPSGRRDLAVSLTGSSAAIRSVYQACNQPQP